MARKCVLLSEIIFLLSLVLMMNESEARHDVRRRSHQHLNVCRKEFLRPLEKRIADVDLVFTGIVERIYQQVESSDHQGSGASDAAPGLQRRRRQHQVTHHRRHRHHYPRDHHHTRQHRQHDGLRSFSQSGIPNWIPGSSGSGNTVNIHYRAIVRVKRVIKGEKRFQGNRVIVEGFGSDKFCVSDAKERDSRIIFANPIANGRLRLHSSLMHVNLENLRKVHLATKAAVLETLAEAERLLSSQTPSTETTATTTTTTTTTTSAPSPSLPQASQSLSLTVEPEKKTLIEPVSMAENEIQSDSMKAFASGKGKKKKSKGRKKMRKNRRKHQRPGTSSTPAREAAIDSASTVSIIESSMLT